MMKNLFTAVFFISYLGLAGAAIATDKADYGRKCSPTGKCTACKNCTGCKHCAKDKGKCSVCR